MLYLTPPQARWPFPPFSQPQLGFACSVPPRPLWLVLPTPAEGLGVREGRNQAVFIFVCSVVRCVASGPRRMPRGCVLTCQRVNISPGVWVLFWSLSIIQTVFIPWQKCRCSKLVTGALTFRRAPFGSGGLAWVETKCHVLFGADVRFSFLCVGEEKDLLAESWQLCQASSLQKVSVSLWWV